MASGHEVLFVSSHGLLEKGKDVVTRAPDGRYCCHQLKTGNIHLSAWHRISGEINELIEQPIELPNVPAGSPFDSYLVTNGTINAVVLDRIDSLNRENQRRAGSLSRLQTLDINQLVPLFSSAELAFLPLSLPDFHSYTSLLLIDGTSLFDPRPIADFVVANLLDVSEQASKIDVRRRLHSSLVVMSNLFHRYRQRNNHLALIHGYVLASALASRFALQTKLAASAWRPTLDMLVAEMGGEAALLLSEAEDSRYWLEGEAFGDGGELRTARITMVLGTLAAVDLVVLARGEEEVSGPRLATLVQELVDEVQLWGESAVPYVATLVLWLERQGSPELARHLLERTVRTVVERNSPDGTDTLATSYYGVEDILLHRYGLTLYPRGSREFRGQSMTIPALLSLCVRRDMRSLLEELWPSMVDIEGWEFKPGDPLDHLAVFVEDGVNTSVPIPEKGSWRQLQEVAAQPSQLQEDLGCVGYLFYALWLVLPQRFRWATVALLDAASEPTATSPQRDPSE